MANYSWKPEDVLHLLGIHYNPYLKEQKIECPSCGGLNFSFSLIKGCGRCFSPGCGFAGDTRKMYAVKEGMLPSEAARTIEERLGIRQYKGEYEDESQEVFKKRLVFQEEKQAEIADVKVRHAAYYAFLTELSLSDKHLTSLLERGFSENDVVGLLYRSNLSLTKDEAKAICRRLIEQGIILEGVPGFYLDKDGYWTFVILPEGIFIPQVNENNLIIGLQLRVDDDKRLNKKTGEIMSKCFWFSSKNYYMGTGAKVSVHVSSDFLYDKETKQYYPVLHGDAVTLTEGGMKADLCRCIFDSRISLIAVQGVNALNPLKECLEALKKYGLKTVNLAYDMDYLTNPNVSDAMKKTREIITELGLEFKSMMNWEEKVVVEGETIMLKGIDDYLAYHFKKIIPKVIRKD